MTTPPIAPDGLEGLTELMRPEHAVDPRSGRQSDPVVRRARRRRGLLITAVITTLVLGLTGGYVGWALTVPVDDAVATRHAPVPPASVAAPIALPTAGASAISVAGADAYLGPSASGIWATSGAPDEPRSIASITKLITALVILDANPLAAEDRGPTLTFDKADNALYDKYYVMGATIAPMPTGTTLSLRDALAAMLIPSACNYAEAIADWAFGSQGAFVGAAKRWLAANGLAHTTIVEPTGIDARNMSTPADLIALGKLAAANPVIAQIAATRSVTLNGPGTIVNTNTLLGTGGITGLKTGTLDGGSHLLYTAALDVGMPEPLTVVGVALGAVSRQAVNDSVLALLGSIAAGFVTVPVAEAGEEVGSYATPWGNAARMVLADDASLFVWSDTPITVDMQTRSPETWADGEVIGTVTWTAGPNTVSVPVELEGDILPPTPWWRLTHPGELG